MKKLLFGLLVILGCSHPVAAVKTVPLPEYEEMTPLAREISDTTVALVHRNMKYDDGSMDGVYRPFCTGVWVSRKMILTARHCVKGLAELTERKEMGMVVEFSLKNQIVDVGVSPSSRWTGKVVGLNKKMDLALIEAGDNISHEVAQLAPQSPGVGSHLAMMGHVRGLYWTYVEGVVSSYRAHYNPMIDKEMNGPFMQVSAPISLGNSGGGAFNMYGHLVGIVSFVNVAPNTAFYIPLVDIRVFLKSFGIK